MTRIREWLFEPLSQVNYLWLNRRAHVFGGQLTYALLVLLQPIIMIGTVQTAISRFDDEYGLIAWGLGGLAFVALSLLVFDGWLSYKDWSARTGVTGCRLGVYLSRLRPWLYCMCAVWSIGLMSTASAEAGLVGMVLYMFYFGVHAFVPMALYIREGCLINQRQKADYLRKTRESGVRDAAV